MKTIKILLFALAAASLAACSDDDENNNIITPDEPVQTLRPLTIEVKENPMVNPDVPATSETKAAITTTSTLSAFNINYVYGATPYTGSTTATKDGEGKWTSKGVWPDTDSEVKWYAYSHGTFLLTDDANKYPYVSFTVEESSSDQQDLLVALTSGTYSGPGSSLSFTFDHACTALRFLVKKANNLSDYTLSITDVTLCNVIKTGDYYYGTQSWTLGSGRSSYTLYSGSAKTLGTASYEAFDESDAPYMFMIPQTLTAWDHTTAIDEATTQTYIMLTCTITKDDSNVYSGTAYIPFTATLTAGYQHDVKINIGKNSLYRSANTKIIN